MNHLRARGARPRRNRLGLVLVVGACLALPAVAAGQRTDGLYAELNTSAGRILIHLEPERAPLTVAAFVGLAEGTIANRAHADGVPVYDGAIFHRVVPGHVIQAADAPTPCSCGIGFEYPNEINAALSHDHAGAVGVPNGGPGTNGAGFYITLGDRSYLDGNYSVFGNVVEGLDVVLRVQRGDTVDRVRILRVGERAESYHPDTNSFRALAAAAERRQRALTADRILAQADWVAERLPGLRGSGTGLRQETISAAEPGDETGTPRRALYRAIALRYTGHIAGYEGDKLEPMPFSSSPDGSPRAGGDADSFELADKIDGVPAALVEAMQTMAPGERRRVLLPAWLGYDRSGYYGPNVPGQPRFVIAPSTMLIYDVQVQKSATALGSARIQATLPDARLAVIPHAGHFPFIEQPAAFLSAVRAFLGSAAAWH